MSIDTTAKKGDTNESQPLSERLRNRRKALGLTLKDVADSAGLSVGFISQVERGLTAPSLSSLVSIAKTLGTEVTEFLEQPRTEMSYSKHDKRRPYRIVGKSVAYERVSASFPGQKLYSVIIHMPPGYRSAKISHEGEEMEFILKGEATSDLDDKLMVLKAGDCVHHKSSKPHSLWNHTDKDTTVLWVGTMDIFGDQT